MLPCLVQVEQELKRAIEQLIEKRTGRKFYIQNFGSSHGGCIHQSGVCSDGRQQYFIKLNTADCIEQFEAEADGLLGLSEAKAIRVPRVIGHGVAGEQAFLVMEALDISGQAPKDGWKMMGQQLAMMHRHVGGGYGWHRSNFIGSTTQTNQSHVTWADFFVQERVKPQFELAEKNGHYFERVEVLVERAEEILNGHEPESSLLHGDLWSGNAAFTQEGEPVIYDPAVYRGDRECDIAFSEFFGGFSPEFYQAYNEVFPMDAEYPKRRDLYNLYHVLNHANLFGGGYIHQAQMIMDEIAG